MTPTTLEAAFDTVVAECRAIFVARQQEYGPDNINAIGVMGLAIEMMNKGARGKRVAAWLDFGYGKQPEKPEDPFLDGANYAIMALMKMRGWWGLPLGPAIQFPHQQYGLLGGEWLSDPIWRNEVPPTPATTHITANPALDAAPVQTMDHGA